MDKVLPDLIVSWPRHLDFPLWRQQIHDNRPLFSKIVVVFTNMNIPKDYRDWIKMVMKEDDITFVDSDPVTASDDWRNVSTNTGLSRSDSEWVLFTEQDFYWKDNFWDVALKHTGHIDIISADVDGRMHPCFILIKRKTLEEKTRKDFGVKPGIADHFSKIQEDLAGELMITVPSNLYTHLGGLSQNLFLMKDKNNVLYYPDEFTKYIKDCLEVGVPIHRDFEESCKEYLQRV